MKKSTLVLIGILAILLFQCKKRKFIKFGNQIVLVNPFSDFRAEHPEYIYAINGQECDLYIIDENGIEIQLASFGISDEIITRDIDWSKNDDFKFTKELTFTTSLSFYNENAYSTSINPLSGEEERTLVVDYYNYLDESNYNLTEKIKPNTIYKWNPLTDTFSDEGKFVDKNDNNNSSNSNDNINNTGCGNYSGLFDCSPSGDTKSYVKVRACVQSETENTITLNVEIKPDNGGPIGSNDNIMTIYYGDNSTTEITYQDFKANGSTSSTFTLNKNLNNTYTWDSEVNMYKLNSTGQYKATPLVTVIC